MNLQQMAQHLIDNGFTQASLARAVQEQGIACSQPTIHRILKGIVPYYDVGDAVRRLYERSIADNQAA